LPERKLRTENVIHPNSHNIRPLKAFTATSSQLKIDDAIPVKIFPDHDQKIRIYFDQILPCDIYTICLIWASFKAGR
jgi:hypothetical protein